MSAWFYKKGGGLFPADDDVKAKVDRMGDGELLQVTIVRPRSVPWMRMYFSIMQAIGENQEPMRDKDSIDAEIRILSGHFDVLHVEGREVRIPKRIAFDKMTANEWSCYWARAEIAIAERFGPEYLDGVPQWAAA